MIGKYDTGGWRVSVIVMGGRSGQALSMRAQGSDHLPIDQLLDESFPDEAPIGAFRAPIPLVLVGLRAAVGGRLAGEGGTNEIPGALGLRRGPR